LIERVHRKHEFCRQRSTPSTEIAITVNPSGVEHWKTIKTQEMFTRHVIPHLAAKK
jgi:hypothetical protein